MSKEDFRPPVRVYHPDVVEVFIVYSMHLANDMKDNNLFLSPIEPHSTYSKVWYKHSNVGEAKLGICLKHMAEEARIEGDMTNKSGRQTGITRMAMKDTPREVMCEITSQRSASFLDRYDNTLLLNREVAMRAIAPLAKKRDGTYHQLKEQVFVKPSQLMLEGAPILQGVSSVNASSVVCHDDGLALIAYQCACFDSSISGYHGFDEFNLTRPFICGLNSVPPFQKPLALIVNAVVPSGRLFLEPSLDCSLSQNLSIPSPRLFAHTPRPYAQTSTPYAHTLRPYAQTSMPYAHTPRLYAQTSRPYAHTPRLYAQTSRPYAHTARPYAQTPKVYIARPGLNASLGSIANYRPYASHTSYSGSAPPCASSAPAFPLRALAYVQSRPKGSHGLSKSLHDFSHAPQVPYCVSPYKIHCPRKACVGEQMKLVQSSLGPQRIVRPLYRSVPKKVLPQFARTPTQILRDVEFMPNRSDRLSYGDAREHSSDSHNVSSSNISGKACI